MYADMVFRYFLNCHLLNLKFCAHAHEQTSPFNRLYLLKEDDIGEWFFLCFFFGGVGGVLLNRHVLSANRTTGPT